MANFIDAFTIVSTNENVVGADVSRMVLEVNKHAHTKTCRKYDCPCRFLYPRYPSIRTIIAEPIANTTEKEANERLIKYKETLKKVGDILNDQESVEEIITRIGSSEKESEEVYKENRVRRIEALVEKAGVTL